MKKLYTFLFILPLLPSLCAQDVVHPFLEDGKTWITNVRTAEDIELERRGKLQQTIVVGDTIVGEHACKKVFSEILNQTFSLFEDIDAHKIFVILPFETKPRLLYDFSLQKGETAQVYSPWHNRYINVTAYERKKLSIGGQSYQGIEVLCSIANPTKEDIDYLQNDVSSLWVENMGDMNGVFQQGKNALIHSDACFCDLQQVTLGEQIFFTRYALSTPYCPVVEKGKQWKVLEYAFNAPIEYQGPLWTYHIGNDVEVGGRTWKQLICSKQSGTNVVALVREEAQRVYIYSEDKPDGRLLCDYSSILGREDCYTTGLFIREGHASSDLNAICEEINAIENSGHTYYTLTLTCGEDGLAGEARNAETTWAERIGNLTFPFSNPFVNPDEISGHALMVVECSVDGEVIYSDVPSNIAAVPNWEEILSGHSTSSDPLLSEGKKWICEWSMAAGNNIFEYPEYNISYSHSINDIPFWDISEYRQYADDKTSSNRLLPNCFIGEKDGKLYFWDGNEEHTPAMFMDFALDPGCCLDFERYVGDEPCNIRLSVTAVSDTIFANSDDHRTRRCLHVTYKSELLGDDTDVWVEGVGSLKYGITFPYYYGATGAIINLKECRNGDTLLYATSDIPLAINPNTNAKNVVPSLFDLHGHRLTTPPTRGVFIRNGKKVVK